MAGRGGEDVRRAFFHSENTVSVFLCRATAPALCSWRLSGACLTLSCSNLTRTSVKQDKDVLLWCQCIWNCFGSPRGSRKQGEAGGAGTGLGWLFHSQLLWLPFFPSPPTQLSGRGGIFKSQRGWEPHCRGFLQPSSLLPTPHYLLLPH